MADQTPIPMVLHCPACGHQHIDAPEQGWDNPPHRSHLCHQCGTIWRPADVPTTGVAAVSTRDSADTWPPVGGGMTGIEAIVLDRADWLLDAIATSTQDRRFLRGDPEYDVEAGEAILLNGAKAIRDTLARSK